MLQVIAGHDPGDPGSAAEPVPDYTAMLGHGVKGLRIGVIRHFYTTDVAGDPEQVKAIDAAVSLFAEAGAEISEIALPPSQDFSACGQIILAAEAYAVHEPWLKEKPRVHGARARERLRGAALRAVDYLQAVRWRLQLRDTVAAAFADIDIAVTASSLDPACRIDDEVGARRQLLAPGADAVQRHRSAGAGHPGGVLHSRPAAVVAARRPSIHRADALPRRPILRGRDGLGETTPSWVG